MQGIPMPASTLLTRLFASTILLMSLVSGLASTILAQGSEERINLREALVAGCQFQVSCRVNIFGTLELQADKSAKQIVLAGSSVIDYSERVLSARDNLVDRTVRLYRKMDFERKVGDQLQQSSLRPESRRLVILRHGHVEVPFCPSGPLTWNEIDLVRTDVFTPALAGLLPRNAVKTGDRWEADAVAVRELTDLERIEEGGLTCTFDAVTTLIGRRQARIVFQGSVRGVGEDGTGRHQLDGHFLFDLVSNHISYVHVRGTHALIDKAGKPTGKIEGTFVLTREAGSQARELSDDALKGLALEPNEDNTLLLHENADLGIRFHYPRRWRVAGTSGRQIALDENRGNGLLITVDAPGKGLTAAQLQDEARSWLAQQKATVHRFDNARVVAAGVEQFSVDVDLAKQRLLLDYFVIRQDQRGATAAARHVPADAASVRKDVDRIIRSVQFVR